MMKETILVIDTGSSGMKGFLFDRTGAILHQVRRSYAMEIDGEKAVQDINDFKDTCYKLVRQLAATAKDNQLYIAAISFTSQRSSLIAVDSAGNPVGKAVMWYDKRSLSVCEEITKKDRTGIWLECGMHAVPALLGPKIKWFMESHSEIKEEVSKYISIQDYLIWLAAGEYVTDPTLASRTHLMNIKTHKWSGKMLDLYGVPQEKLCNLVETGSVIARTRQEFMAETGLTEAIPVITAGGDQQCSVLGQGITKSGAMGVTLGSGGYAVTVMDKPAASEITGAAICASAVPEKWNYEYSCPAAGTAYDWCRKVVGTESLSHHALDQYLNSAGPGANGIIAIADFAGKSIFDKKSSGNGCFLNIGLDHTKADLLRAGVEGILALVTEKYEQAKESAGTIHSATITGGLTRSAVVCQIVCDMFGIPIQAADMEETTAAGAWAVASSSLGWYQSSEQASQQINRSCNIYQPDESVHQLYQEQAFLREQIRGKQQ